MSLSPTTQYEPTPSVADLSDSETRERLSQGALKGFFNIISHWNVKNDDAMRLLGGVSNGKFHAYKKEGGVLDQDKITRISYLIGIFKALNLLHGEDLADKWVSLPNKNPIFRNQTPLEYMIRGGIPAMQTVRNLLDARRGGM